MRNEFIETLPMPAGTVSSRNAVNRRGGIEVVLRDCGNACSKLGSWPISGLEARSRITEKSYWSVPFVVAIHLSVLLSLAPVAFFPFCCRCFLFFSQVNQDVPLVHQQQFFDGSLKCTQHCKEKRKKSKRGRPLWHGTVRSEEGSKK